MALTRGVIDQLLAGQTIVKTLTIPEGLTIQKIAELMPKVNLSSDVFLASVIDSGFISSLEIPTNSLEGYLFPETYYLHEGMTERELIKMMVQELRVNFPDTERVRANNMGFSVHEIISLAAIIEAEAQVATERPTISAVYHNRLKRGMLLQADPTVQYALGKWKSRLYYKDLEVDSPYNTRKYASVRFGQATSRPRNGTVDVGKTIPRGTP